MTDSSTASAPAPSPAARFGAAVVRETRRVPATISMVLAILVVGIVSGALWHPLGQSGVEIWATGLRAFEEGRWWTALTATFLTHGPWAYPPTLLLVAVCLGALERLRGSRVALAYFWVGQLFAVFATALLFAAFSMFPNWSWAIEAGQWLSLGASAGALACAAAVIGVLAPPWRTRGWIVLLVVLIVAVLVFGTVGDLERLAAVLLVLIVDRTLRPQRATVREQRLVAFTALIAFVGVEIILSVIPTNGPFGATQPLSGWSWSTAIDLLVVLLIANGLRRARRWAWVSAVVLLALNVAAAGVRAVIASFDLRLGLEEAIEGTAVDIGTGILAVLLLGYLILVRHAFRSHRRARLAEGGVTRTDAANALRTWGGGTLSWMTTWEGNSYLRTSTGLVAFQQHAGAAIALADPLGPEDGRASSVTEFIAAAEHAGLAPCLFSVGDAARAAMPSTWRSLVVADDTIVDLPGLAFRGKRWNSVRTSLNRGGREDITFRLTRLVDEPWSIRAQLNAISEAWVGEKELPEMRFTLGTLEEAEDPEVRLALALNAHGEVDGFLSWLPVYGDGAVRGWTLDLMRRRDDGFGAVMEYLIAMSANAFRDEGCEIMSLSGAPLAHEYPPEARVISQLSARLAEALDPVYGFQSLHRFKAKFQPRYETVYLLFRDEADLARIGAGLTRAFLPDATPRQFARAGLELVRGTDG